MKKLSSVMMMVVLICLSVLMLGACGKKEVTAGDIVGTWTHTTDNGNDMTYVFYSDGKMQFLSELGDCDGTYSVSDNTISYSMLMPNGVIKQDTMAVELGDGYINLTKNGTVYAYYKQ